MRTNQELIRLLRKYASYQHPGRMGDECVVSKNLLKEVADRLEEYSEKHDYYDDFEPITHFFQD